MILNQKQIYDLVFADVTAAQAAGRPNEICYVESTKSVYAYIASGSSYTVDGLKVLSTGNGGDTRWVVRAGEQALMLFTAGSVPYAGSDGRLTEGNLTYASDTLTVRTELQVLTDDSGTDRGVVLKSDLANNSGVVTTPNNTTSLELRTNGTTAISIDPTGYTGIGGILDPNTVLHIEDTSPHVQISSSAATGNSSYIDFANQNSIRAQIQSNLSDNSLIFKTGGTTTAMTIDDSQNIGIGIDAPDGHLHVHTGTAGSVTAATSADDIVIENSGDAGLSILTPATDIGRINFGDLNNDVASIRYDHSTDKMHFDTAGAIDMLTINGTGVGVGTTSPEYQLQIENDGSYSQFGMTSYRSAVTPHNSMYLKASRGSKTTPVALTSGDEMVNLIGYGHDGTDFIQSASIKFATEGTIATNRIPSYISFNTHPDSTSAITERLRITSGGYLQSTDGGGHSWGGEYGTDIPTIFGTVGSGFNIYPTGTTSGLVMQVLEDNVIINKNVGIGITSPSDNLHIQPTTDGGITISNATGGTAATLSNSASSGTDARGSLGLYDNGSLNVYLRGVDNGDSYFNTGGNVGIGNSSLEAWWSGYSALQVGGNGSIFAHTTAGAAKQMAIGQNVYHNGAAWIYQDTDEASLYYQQSGQHNFNVVASGTAGNAITFTTAMTIDNSGNVGIGVSPSYKLHVKHPSSPSGSAVMIESDVADSYPSIRLKNDSQEWRIYNDSQRGDSLSIYDGTNYRFYLDPNGNAALGPNVPEAWHSSFTALQINVTSSIIAAVGTLYLSENVYHDGSWKRISTSEASNYYQDSGQHVFRVAGSAAADSAITWTTAMIIDNSGSVIIGGTSAADKLHVQDGSILAKGADTETNLAVTNDVAFKLWNSSDTDGGFTSLDFINSQAATTAKIAAVFTDAGDRDTDLVFMTRANGGTITEKMRIDNTGNVGIGVNPVYDLDVVGDINLTGNYYKGGVLQTFTSQWTTSGSDIYFTSGNVGINHTTPEKRIHVVNDSTNTTVTTLSNTIACLQNEDTTTGNYAALEFRGKDTGGTERSGASIAGVFTARSASMVQTELAFTTRDVGGTVTEAMRIDGDGNVGIGQAPISSKFEVKMTGNGNPLLLRNSTDQAIFYVYNNDSVGSVVYVNQDDGTIGIQLASEGSSYFNGGNVGIGNSSLEDWDAGYTALQIGSEASIIASTVGGLLDINQNAYYDGQWKRITADEATIYEQTGGTHRWYYTESDAADSVITWKTSLYSSSNGKIGVRTDSPVNSLTVVDYTTPAITTMARPVAQFSGSAYIDSGVYGIGFNYSGGGETTPVFVGYKVESGAGNTKGSLVFGTRDTTVSGDVPSTRMTINAAGHVGIGNDSLEAWNSSYTALQIGGNSSINSPTTAGTGNVIFINQNAYFSSAGWKYQDTDEASSYFQNDGTHNFRVAASGTADTAITWVDALKIDNAGNVGIGKVPSYALDVNGEVKFGTATYYGRLGYSASGGGHVFMGSDSAHTLHLRAGGSSKVYITTTGEVGIGTGSPTSLLHVQATVNGNWAAQIENLGATGAHGLYVNLGSSSTGVPFRVDKDNGILMQVTNAGQVGIGSFVMGSFGLSNELAVGVDSGTNGGIAIYNKGQNAGTLSFGDGVSGTVSYEGYVQYAHNTDSMHFGTSHTTRMTIDSSGKVGIGQSNPSATLHILNNSNAFAFDTSTVNAVFYIDGSDGDLTGSDYGNITHSGTYLSMGTHGNDTIYMDANSNVGIGGSPSSFRLQVNGNFRVYNNGNSSQVWCYDKAVTSNETNYYQALIAFNRDYDISSGVTDSGYRVGLTSESYVSDASFLGTLNQQWGALIRHGSYNSAGHINDSRGIYIETLTGGSTTFDNLYGLYQESSAAKNYFAGNLGIGTDSPASLLHVSENYSTPTGGIDTSVLATFSSTDADYASIQLLAGTEYGCFIYFGDTDNADIGKIFYNNNADSMHFWTNAAERMTIDSAGNVGIGTTDPSNRLDVLGGSAYTQLRVTEAKTNATIQRTGLVSQHYTAAEEPLGLILGYSGSTSSDIYIGGGTSSVNATERIIFYTAANHTTPYGTARMAISNAGNVGMGTTSPQSKLHLHEGSSNGVLMQFTNDTTGATVGDGTIIGLSSDENFYILNRENTNIWFQTNATNNMVFDNNGNLGIGTTNPTYKLEVAYSGALVNPIMFREIRAQATGRGGIINFGGYNDDGASSLTTFAQVSGRKSNATTGNENGYFQIDVNTGSGLEEAMRIDSDKQVGIGVTDPKQSLDVLGTISVQAASSTAPVFQMYEDDDNRTTVRRYGSASSNANKLAIEHRVGGNWVGGFWIDASGNIGINNSNPSSYNADADDLVVGNGGHAGLTVVSGTTSRGAVYFADGTAGSEPYRGYIYYDHSAEKMQFGTGGTDSMIIDTNGNVGIGVDPVTKLHMIATGEFFIGPIGKTDGFGLTYDSSGGTSVDFMSYHDATSATMNFIMQQSGTPVTAMTIDGSGTVFIGDTTNANMTQGITINQGAADNEILAFKSSDVAHSFTGITEADTYGLIKKYGAPAGGLSLQGFAETSYYGMEFKSYSVAGAGFRFDAFKSDGGTGATAIDDTDVLLYLINNGTGKFRVNGIGATFIGDSANANSTLGLTINQAGNDDEILSLKSSDVAHGVTSIAETDTFGFIKKDTALGGGLLMHGIAESNQNTGTTIEGTCGTSDSTTGTASVAAVVIKGADISGTSQTTWGNDDNILAVINNTVTRFIFKGDGDFRYDGSASAFDVYDDAVACSDLSNTLSGKHDKFIKYNKQALSSMGVITTEGDSTFVSTKGMNMLQLGAITEIYGVLQIALDKLGLKYSDLKNQFRGGQNVY